MQLITPHLRPGLGYIEEFWAPLAKVDSDYNKAYWDFLYGRIEQPEFAKRGKQLQDAWMQQIERLKKGAYDPAIGRALQNRASHSPDEE